MTRRELIRNIWMTLATIATAVVVYLVVRPPAHVAPSARDLSVSNDVAQFVGPGLLTIAPGSALERKLEVRSVKAETVELPLLTVTASVAAHSVPSAGSPLDRWQFASADISNAYADWRRTQNDVEFSEKQLAKARELAVAQVARYTEVFERLKKLVDTGTETQRDLVAAQADLLQAEIQTQKDVFEVESAHNLALRSRAAAERALAQAGLDPRVLDRPDGTAIPGGTAIIVAQVPEAKVALVQEGQACTSRFYAFPDEPFVGRVARVAPALSPERRTLRVLFELPDAENRLKPGMFADVGLGTDPRSTRIVPVDAVVHVGRGDFVFARAAGSGTWRIVEVRLGEVRGSSIEVLDGVTTDEEVIGSGAILLKPFVIRTVESQA